MNTGTKLAATALAAMLAGAPVGAFAWTGSQSNAGPATSNQSADQSAPMGDSSGMPGGQQATQGQQAMQGQEASQGQQQLSQNTVAQVQQKLQQDGFYQNGKVDGMMGPHTHTALMNFQKSKGLTPSGQLDNQTVAALGINQQPGTSPDAAQSNNG